jgi:PAS domain S-box-containing protein
VRYHLALLVALATVPLVFFTAWIVRDLGREQRASVEQGLQATASALAIAVEREIAATTRALEVLAMSEAIDRGDLAAFHHEVVRAVTVNDTWYIVAMADVPGQIVLASTRPYGASLPFIGDRRYVQDVIQYGRPAVSDLLTGRTTGQRNISVAVPVRRNHSVRYVLFAGLNPEALGRIIAAERIPATSQAAVADSRQVIIAGSQNLDRFVGRELMAPIKEAVRAAPEGTGRFAVPGAPEVYAAWQRMSALGWTVTLGEPVALVDASLRRSMWRVAIIGIVVVGSGVAVTLLVGHRISRAMATLTASATALGRGAVPVYLPSAIAEVDAVGRALEQAGATIEARTAELVASQATTRRLVDSNLIGIIVGEDDRLVDANGAFLRMVGYRHDELADGTLPWSSLTPPAYAAADAAALASARATGECAPYEKEYVRKDGTRVPVLAGAAALDDGGRWVGFALDLTEHKRLEEERKLRAEAEAANRMKDAFLAMVSHELRTPLAVVLGSIRALASGRLAPDAAHAAMERIERNTQLQARLIDDLLDLSRIVTGKLQVDPKPVQVGLVVRDAVAACRDDADRMNVKLEESVPAACLVLGDAERLQQIVQNLVGNAIKFTPAGGSVTVTVEPRGSRVVLTVRDTGIGIDPELLPHLFEPFRQASTARGRGGLGLGLAIVRHLVTIHGGTVVGESEGPGSGSVFTVELPALREAESSPRV